MSGEACKTCKHFSCICAIIRLHALGCPFRTAATCSTPIECGHGRDTCPTCDKCTCADSAAQSQEAYIQGPKENEYRHPGVEEVLLLSCVLSPEDSKKVVQLLMDKVTLRDQIKELERGLESTKPKYDATDGAHPCWWRGHENGARGMEAKLKKQHAMEMAEQRAYYGALLMMGNGDQ